MTVVNDVPIVGACFGGSIDSMETWPSPRHSAKNVGLTIWMETENVSTEE